MEFKDDDSRCMICKRWIGSDTGDCYNSRDCSEIVINTVKCRLEDLLLDKEIDKAEILDLIKRLQLAEIRGL